MSKNDPTHADAARQPEAAEEKGDWREDAATEGATSDSTSAEGGEAVQADFEALRAELETARDRALRCQAELENYRKRVARQTEEERRYANLPLLRDLLHVWDNMGRAIEAAEQANHNDSLLEGFKMVARQLEEIFQRYHCTKIEALGKPFDPHLHEAISQQPSEEHLPGTVTLETRAGFRLFDRVVRPSQVIVSAAAAKENHEGETDQEQR